MLYSSYAVLYLINKQVLMGSTYFCIICLYFINSTQVQECIFNHSQFLSNHICCCGDRTAVRLPSRLHTVCETSTVAG